jgi:putative membrane protein
MKKTYLMAAPALLALVLSAGGAGAQTAPTPGTGSSVTGGGAAPAAQAGAGTRNAETRKDDKVARGDRKFIQKAAESGMFEVQSAQLAASKATDPQVKSFASMLVDHHTAANNELIQIANAKGVEIPAAPPRGMRKDVEKLGKKSGNDFDKEFVKEVGIKAHEKDIKLFEHASKDVKDAQLKAFVDKTLPVLRQHLQAAKALPESGKSGASMGNRGSSGHNMGGNTGTGNTPGQAGPGGVGGGSLNPSGKGS